MTLPELKEELRQSIVKRDAAEKEWSAQEVRVMQLHKQIWEMEKKMRSEGIDPLAGGL